MDLLANFHLKISFWGKTMVVAMVTKVVAMPYGNHYGCYGIHGNHLGDLRGGGGDT